MLKVSGYWLIATSIIHVLVGLLVFNEPLAETPATDGSMQSLPIPLPYFDRRCFLVHDGYPFILQLGSSVFWSQARQIILPRF